MTIETDAAGYPKRSFGDKLIVNGRKVVVLVNLGMFMLCPCPDMLKVRYAEGIEGEVQNDNFDTW